MSRAIHCDECDTWGRGTMTQGFVRVNWDGLRLDFCSWDCLLRHGMTRKPITRIQPLQ